MNEQLLKTSGADVFSTRKKLRKTLLGVASTPHPPVKCYGHANKAIYCYYLPTTTITTTTTSTTSTTTTTTTTATATVTAFK